MVVVQIIVAIAKLELVCMLLLFVNAWIIFKNGLNLWCNSHMYASA